MHIQCSKFAKIVQIILQL